MDYKVTLEEQDLYGEDEIIEHKSGDDVMLDNMKDNAAETLQANLLLLSSIDLKDRLDFLENQNTKLRGLLSDLIDMMTLDDSIVSLLKEKGDDLDFDDIKGLKSIVESWDYNSTFKTLADKNKDLLEELLGPKKYESKLRRAKKTRLKRSKNKLNR